MMVGRCPLVILRGLDRWIDTYNSISFLVLFAFFLSGGRFVLKFGCQFGNGSLKRGNLSLQRDNVFCMYRNKERERERETDRGE